MATATQSEKLKDLAAEDEGDEKDAGDAVAAAGKGEKLSDGEQSAALSWFLSHDLDEAEQATRTLELNWGTEEKPDKVLWTIKPIGIDTLRAIRRKATGTRAARRGGMDIDEYRVNLEVIVEGTIDPDLHEAARIKFQRNEGSPDPVDLLRARFQSKPGFVTQIAGEIMSLSGFEEEDVREVDAGKP